MRRAVLLALLLVVPAGCGSDGGEVGTGASTTTAPGPGGGGDRLELCSDVVPFTTDVIGTLGAMGNVDTIFMGVIAAYGQEHPDTYGGHWIDRDAGGTVVVAFTDDPEPHLEALRRRRPSDAVDTGTHPTDSAGNDGRPPIVDDRPIGEWDQTFDVVQVHHTERELRDAEDAASGALELAGVEVTGWGTDITRNTISVDVEHISQELLDEAAPDVAEVVPLDMICIAGVLESELPPPIDPDAPLDVIVLPGADGTYPAETEADCGGERFTLGALDPLVPVEESGIPELAAALEDGLAEGEGMPLPAEGWSVLDADDERATLISLGDESMTTITFEATRAGWSAAGSMLGEPCDVVVPLPDGYGEVEWSLDPELDPPGMTSTELHVLVSETACASGQALGDRLLGPQVVVTDDAVRVAFAAIPLSGAQSCQGNPPEPITVALDEPLGERDLLDGRIIGPIDELVAGD